MELLSFKKFTHKYIHTYSFRNQEAKKKTFKIQNTEGKVQLQEVINLRSLIATLT